MRILALDISKRGTGFALGDGSREPVSGVMAFGGHDRGQTGAAYAKWLRDLLALEKPGLVACEAAILIANQRSGADIARLLLGLSFATEMVCHLAGTRSVLVPVQTWRKAFLGHGRPTDPKKAAIEMCRLLGWDVGGDHNQAEACGVWCWAHLHHGDKQAMHRLLSASSLRTMQAKGAA